MKKLLLVLTIALSLNAFAQKAATKQKQYKIHKTDAEWKKQLTPAQYNVLRHEGTELAYTDKEVDSKAKGKYACGGCGFLLFDSANKYHSGTGWPSFDRAISGAVVYKTDTSLGITRTEVKCANCGGHLGHRFDDGPLDTTGKRFCMNSVAMKFIPAK